MAEPQQTTCVNLDDGVDELNINNMYIALILFHFKTVSNLYYYNAVLLLLIIFKTHRQWHR